MDPEELEAQRELRARAAEARAQLAQFEDRRTAEWLSNKNGPNSGLPPTPDDSTEQQQAEGDVFEGPDDGRGSTLKAS